MKQHVDYYSNSEGLQLGELINGQPFAVGSILKYCWRYDKKGTPKKDLQKTIDYAFSLNADIIAKIDFGALLSLGSKFYTDKNSNLVFNLVYDCFLAYHLIHKDLETLKQQLIDKISKQ